VTRLARPPLLDILLGVSLATAGVVELWARGDGVYGRGSSLVNVPLVLLATLPLAWRRRAPLGVLVVMTCGFILPQLVAPLTISFWGDFLPYSVAIYTLAAYESPRRAGLGVAFALVAFGLAYSARSEFRTANNIAFDMVVLAVAYGGGTVARRRAELEVRAAVLEHERKEAARASVIEERARIARELHDVVSHTISLIVVQAGAAERVLNHDRSQVERALNRIQRAGREAIDEMQLLLGTFDGGQDSALLGPQPTLSRLDELTQQLRDAGLHVDLEVEGIRDALPAPIELSAYRVIQEALTNALKHGTGGRAHVTVCYRQDALELSVVNPCSLANRNGDRGGRGLIGMRERVLLLDGTFDAGRRDATYRVQARIPLRAASQ
jgi:signal transduction histidine kinase